MTDDRFDDLLVVMAAAVAVSDVVGEAQREREDPDRWVPLETLAFVDEPWSVGIAQIPVPQITLPTADCSTRRRWVTVPVIFWTQCGEVVHLDNHVDTLDSPEMNCTLFAAMNAPMWGRPRRPRRIITDDRRIATALGIPIGEGAASDFATVEVSSIEVAKRRAVEFFVKALKRACDQSDRELAAASPVLPFNDRAKGDRQ